MVVKVNIDTFYIGPKSSALKWNLKRRYPFFFAINRLQWYYFPKKLKVPIFPLHVDFELSSLCNMDCPMCFRQGASYDSSKSGVMDLDIFKKGIDECAKNRVYSIRLSWRGECTTNPHIVEMIKYAKRRGVKEISFITNGYKIEGKLAEDIVKAGVDYITISVDGLYDEYDKIRYPSTFEGTVIRLRNLRRLRDTIGNGYPRIRINSVWKESKGMDWFQDMYDYFSEIVDFMTFTSEFAYDKTTKNLRPDFTCQYPYQRITIMWNGVIPLCIADKRCDYSLGNLREDNIYDVWHGEKMKNARDIHLAHRASALACCATCERAVTKQVGNINVS